jgi:hypothetical protein
VPLYFRYMGATIQTPAWPTDPGHRDAIDTLLEMARAEHRWGEHGRALMLLDRVRQIVGALPPGYERIRERSESRRAALAEQAPRGVQFSHALVASTRRGGGRPTGR